MTQQPTLGELIAWARTVTMTPEQLTAQRRSFAYGNCKIENDRITRQMVADADAEGNVMDAMEH